MPSITGVVRTLLLAVSLITTTACVAKPRPYLVAMQGGIAREGSVEECISKQLQQGLSVRQAIDACTAKGVDYSGARTLDPTRLFGMFGHKTPVVSAAVCSSSQSDPRGNLPVMDALSEEIRMVEMWKDKRDALVQEQRAATSQNDKDAIQGEIDTISKALNEEWKRWTDLISEKAAKDDKERNEPPPPPGDFPVPDPDQPKPARPVGDQESPCEQTMAFLGECNRDGWNSPDCKALLDRLDHCLDPTVSDPVGGDEKPCGLPAVDPDKVQDVMMALCSSKKRYGPDDNPCDFRVVPGVAREYWGGQPPENDPCKNPVVRTTDDACLPKSITIVEFKPIDLNALRKWAIDNLGGPVFLFPLGPPHDSGTGGPKPPPF